MVYLSTALLTSLIFSLVSSSPFTSVGVVVRTVSLKPSLGLISKCTDISHMESSVKQFLFKNLHHLNIFLNLVLVLAAYHLIYLPTVE